MSEIRFHETVMTPNGPGIVHGILHRSGKPETLLISHEPRVFAPSALLNRAGKPKPVGEQISKETAQPGIWILFAYPFEMVQPVRGR